jgi:hypothetical protein
MHNLSYKLIRCIYNSSILNITTGIERFVECFKHSAKSLSSVTFGKESSTNSTSTTIFLPSIFYRTLDKDFAECQSGLGKEK